jgi:hypothetical protein
MHGVCWRDFNLTLRRDADALINEAAIEYRLDTLRQMEPGGPRVFWLTLARIAELAIMQAGIYADNCEFQAAGDLLVNPRRIDVYRRGREAPVSKDRHRALSDQFAADIGSENPAAWLSRETITHIRQEALLPFLKEMLSSSGMMAPAYLEILDRRMQRVADAIGFLMSWQVRGGLDLFERIKTADPSDRESVAAHLCTFTGDIFHAMGDDIERLILNGDGGSRFLRCPPATSSEIR